MSYCVNEEIARNQQAVLQRFHIASIIVPEGKGWRLTVLAPTGKGGRSEPPPRVDNSFRRYAKRRQ